MSIDKVEEDVCLIHEFIQLNYTYLVSQKNENNVDSGYKTENIKLVIPSIEMENYKILSKYFIKPTKNDYTSLLDILKKNNQDDKMDKLLLYTKLEVNLQSNKNKSKPKKI